MTLTIMSNTSLFHYNFAMDTMNANNFSNRRRDDYSSLQDNDPPDDHLLDDEQLTSAILNGFDSFQSVHLDEFSSLSSLGVSESLFGGDWLVASPEKNDSSGEPNGDSSLNLPIDENLDWTLFEEEESTDESPMLRLVPPSSVFFDHCYTQSLHSSSDSLQGRPSQAAASEHSSSDSLQGRPSQAASEHMSDWSSTSERLGSRESSVDDIFSLVDTENRKTGHRVEMLAKAGDQVKSLVEKKLAKRKKPGEGSAASSQQSRGEEARRTKPRASPVPKLKKWNALTEEEQLENMTELTDIISSQLGVRERFDAIKIIDPKCGISHTDGIDKFVLDKNVLKRLNNTRFYKLQKFVRLHAGDYGSKEPTSPDSTEQPQPLRLLVDVTNDAPTSPPRKVCKVSYTHETDGAGVEISSTPSKAGKKKKSGGGRRGRKSNEATSCDMTTIWIADKDEQGQRNKELLSGLFINNVVVALDSNEENDEDLNILD